MRRAAGRSSAPTELAALFGRLQGRRREIGEEALFRASAIPGDIEEFIALANHISGEHLRSFFDRWLFERGKP